MFDWMKCPAFDKNISGTGSLMRSKRKLLKKARQSFATIQLRTDSENSFSIAVRDRSSEF
jgi:hypothetical protein